MPLSIDWFGQTIQVTSPTVAVDAQVLHDFIEDQMATPVGKQHDDIINPEGKVEDETNPGVFSQIILIFNSPWQIQFWQGSGYTRVFGGKVIGGLANEVIKATGAAGDVTVLESPVDGLVVATGISGLTASESAALLNIETDVNANTNVLAGMNRPKKNTAMPNLHFLMRDSSDKSTPKTGLTVIGQRCIDNGAWTAMDNAVVEIADGLYRIDLSAADTNGDTITYKFDATGAVTAYITVFTSP